MLNSTGLVYDLGRPTDQRTVYVALWVKREYFFKKTNNKKRNRVIGGKNETNKVGLLELLGGENDKLNGRGSKTKEISMKKSYVKGLITNQKSESPSKQRVVKGENGIFVKQKVQQLSCPPPPQDNIPLNTT